MLTPVLLCLYRQKTKNNQKWFKKYCRYRLKNKYTATVYLCNGGEGSCTAEIPTFDTNLPSDLNQLDIFYVFIISQ